MFEKLFRTLRTIDISEGFSVNTNGAKPESGYMVSRYGAEFVVNHVPSLIEIEDYLLRIVDLHGMQFLGDAYIGGWFDSETSKYFLDVSDNFKSLSMALEIAKENKQLAIFNLSTFQSIYL